MAERIVCTHVNGTGRECGRFLGEVNAGQVLIYCPACKALHAVEIVDLARHLSSYLDQIEQQSKTQKRRVVGFA
jgi:phage FluMu protein Com